MKKLLPLLICILLVPSNGFGMEKEDKLLWLNGATSGLLLYWGVEHWGYSLDTHTHAESEGWFGLDTDEGGADKFGHMFTAYAATHAFAMTYDAWGYTEDDAVLYGAYSSFAFTALMEVGDAYSPYGFSKEDFLANTLGTLWGYVSYKYPEIQDRIDFRVEYPFSKSRLAGDFVTDYENMKHLLVLKASGFESFDESWIRYLELRVGYYARGFVDPAQERERFTYVGIGLNLAELLDMRFFNYYQMPDTDVTMRERY